MKKPTIKFLGLTWVGWLNILILQWLFIRLYYEIYIDNGQLQGWGITAFVLPLTGWFGSSYIGMTRNFALSIILCFAILIPFQTKAIEPGYGGDLKCLASNETGTGARCSDTQDLFKRTYNLEAKIKELENLNRQLESKINSVSSAQPVQIVSQPQDSSRIEQLEQRVGVLERAYKAIQESVMSALETTIGLLKKIVSK